MAEETQRAPRLWLRLDNAAKLYPAIASVQWTSMFRLSFVMREQVVPTVLEEAVNQTLVRFPAFRVKLRKGLFWYYLEAIDDRFRVCEDIGHPCLPLKHRENSGYLFRVKYGEYRISLEMFHALADGTGGLIFLKSIVAQYLRLCGVPVPCEIGILDPTEKPAQEEMEDAYRKIPLDGVHASRKEDVAYQMPGTPEPPHTLHVILAQVSVQALKNAAAPYGVTITEYLTAVMLYTLWQTQQKGHHQTRLPVKVSVPVNMRKFVPTKTVRNFAFFVNVGIDPKLGHYTFEETVQLVHHALRYHMNPKFLFAGIATNVASERNLLVRLCPLPLKNFVLSFVYHRVGERLFTTTLTNVGPVKLPSVMAERIERAEMMLGAASSYRSNCAAVSLGDNLCLTFTRDIAEADFERNVLCFLVERGIAVRVSSNQE